MSPEPDPIQELLAERARMFNTCICALVGAFVLLIVAGPGAHNWAEVRAANQECVK
jgi:hypothetical protein